MPKPRRLQVDPQSTPYYHCISRCVRRAFLCGKDRLSGRNFDHRRHWLIDRMKFLAAIFTIDICAYGCMSNHYHLVLRLCADQARRLSDHEVVERYRMLFPDTVRRWEQGTANDRAVLVQRWRARLCDLSWYMRCLNESIARRANREDGCTGRFWEGRFRSQALLDEGALLTCMSYVDLNPIRAGVASSIEESEFTSVYERLQAVAREQRVAEPERREESRGDGGDAAAGMPRRAELVAFWSGVEESEQTVGRWSEQCLPMTLDDYVLLLRETAAALRSEAADPRLSAGAAGSLRRLGLSPPGFVETVRRYATRFFGMVGETHRIDLECERRQYRRRPGRPAAAHLYAAA